MSRWLVPSSQLRQVLTSLNSLSSQDSWAMILPFMSSMVLRKALRPSLSRNETAIVQVLVSGWQRRFTKGFPLFYREERAITFSSTLFQVGAADVGAAACGLRSTGAPGIC